MGGAKPAASAERIWRGEDVMKLPKSAALDLEVAEGWLTVWFNQPEARNPLTAARIEALVALCAALKGRRDIRGVTFRGRGAVFCAGAT